LSADSFNQLIGAQDQAGRNFEPERLRRLEVDDHLQLGRLPGPSTAGYRIGRLSSGGISPILQASKRGADEEAMVGFCSASGRPLGRSSYPASARFGLCHRRAASRPTGAGNDRRTLPAQ
jgi:hypothetical protein